MLIPLNPPIRGFQQHHPTKYNSDNKKQKIKPSHVEILLFFLNIYSSLIIYCWRWLVAISSLCVWFSDALLRWCFAVLCPCIFFILFLLFSPHPLFALLLISLHPTTEVNVEHNLAVALLAIWCSVYVCVCVCVCVCLFVLVFLDVDSRLGRTSHKQSCSVRVDLESYLQRRTLLREALWIFLDIDWLNIACNIRHCQWTARHWDVTLCCIVWLLLCTHLYSLWISALRFLGLSSQLKGMQITTPLFLCVKKIISLLKDKCLR